MMSADLGGSDRTGSKVQGLTMYNGTGCITGVTDSISGVRAGIQDSGEHLACLEWRAGVLIVPTETVY